MVAQLQLRPGAAGLRPEGMGRRPGACGPRAAGLPRTCQTKQLSQHWHVSMLTGPPPPLHQLSGNVVSGIHANEMCRGSGVQQHYSLKRGIQTFQEEYCDDVQGSHLRWMRGCQSLVPVQRLCTCHSPCVLARPYTEPPDLSCTPGMGGSCLASRAQFFVTQSPRCIGFNAATLARRRLQEESSADGQSLHVKDYKY